jgi:hypothetical protein
MKIAIKLGAKKSPKNKVNAAVGWIFRGRVDNVQMSKECKIAHPHQT